MLWSSLYVTIIPKARTGYETMDSQRGGIIISYPTSVGYEKTKQKLLDLSDFALHEQPEDNLMVSISQAWHNSSYTMVAKSIKFLELHYTMTQFK